jgi:hypothetical protein
MMVEPLPWEVAMRKLLMSTLLGSLTIASAGAQTSQSPKLLERMIDACIDSYRFPPVQGQQCSQEAQRIIADAFCWYQRRPKASTWDVIDTRAPQKSFKLSVQQVPNDADLGQWVPYDQGSAVFGRINCEGSPTPVEMNAPAPDSEGRIRIEITVKNQPNIDINQIRKLMQSE